MTVLYSFRTVLLVLSPESGGYNEAINKTRRYIVYEKEQKQ